MGREGAAWGARVPHGERGCRMGRAGAAWGERVPHGERGCRMGREGAAWLAEARGARGARQ
jgi:hypothetical protein